MMLSIAQFTPGTRHLDAHMSPARLEGLICSSLAAGAPRCDTRAPGASWANPWRVVRSMEVHHEAQIAFSAVRPRILAVAVREYFLNINDGSKPMYSNFSREQVRGEVCAENALVVAGIMIVW